MKKRIGAFLLAGAMLLSMTGCGNNKAKEYSKYVELGEYKGIEYTRPEVAVTEDEVQAQIDSFLTQNTESEEITDRAVQDGDVVNIDYVGTMDGVAFDGGTAEGQSLTIGSNSFIDGFESGLIGHEIGEKVSLDLQFPDPYDNSPDLAGKDVTFEVTINSISVETTPELTDAFVKENTDYDTVAAYKESVKEDLQTQAESNAESTIKSDVFNKVVASCTINGYDEAEVKKLVDEEFEGFKETAATYEAYGYSYEDVLNANGYETEEALLEGITEYVKNYMSQKMVVYMIADKEDLKVTSEETDKFVQEYMTALQVETEEEVYEYFGDETIELQLLSEKVIEFLVENAVEVEATADTTESTTETTTEE